jgi:hypothetical protein
MTRQIWVFGNPDLEIDSLPLRLLPSLKKTFPKIEFRVLDSNEEWQVPEDLVILDTAMGVKEITIFDDLKKFESTPRVSLHDFDALTNLRLLQKLGKLKKIKIIGLPPMMEEKHALEQLKQILDK